MGSEMTVRQNRISSFSNERGDFSGDFYAFFLSLHGKRVGAPTHTHHLCKPQILGKGRTDNSQLDRARERFVTILPLAVVPVIVD